MFMLKKFLGDIKENKDLIKYLTFFELKSNISRTYLGFLWWILDPVLYMAIFYVLVHVILGRGGPDYPVILFVALIPLKWTTACLVDSTTAISSKARIIKQIYVPKIVLILVRFFVNTIKFSISCVVLILFLLFYGIPLSAGMLLFPLLILVHGLFLVPVMVLFSHIGVYTKDIKNMMQYISRLLFYLSPVLFTLETVPVSIRNLFFVNPLTTYIESYRNVLLYNEAPLWLGLGILILVSLVLFYLSLKLLFKYENEYAKVI